MLHVSAAGWTATIILVLGLLGLDLGLSVRRPHAVGIREAVVWSTVYIVIACLFGLVLGLQAGWSVGGQYFAGFVVEKSLSVDNLFVFVIIVATFAVPSEHQPRALTIGIALALALRIVFIAVGAALLDAFSFMFLLFGLALVVTAVQLMRHRDEDPTVEDNPLVSAARRVLPLSDRYLDGRLVARVDGRRVFTPMFLVMVAIGSTDLLFALDSIPAVFGVTQHTYVVLTANAFALIGLRPLFFLVSALLKRLVYLSTGLAVILIFIGVKLILHFAHTQDAGAPEISTAASLGVIVVVLAATGIASALAVRRDPTLAAHAGSVREHRAQTERAREDSNL